MDTKQEGRSGRRRWRRHSDEFKAKMVEACRAPGVSVAAVALANELNANLLRSWIAKADGRAGRSSVVPAAGFVPLTVAPAPAAEIAIEVQRGATRVQIRWPAQAAGECALWLREWLR
jgi:transposase-like protein